MTVISEKLIIYLLHVGDVPRLAASITVDTDLKAIASVDQKVVPRQHYKVLLTGDTTSQLSQIVNFVARVNTWATDTSHSDTLSAAAAARWTTKEKKKSSRQQRRWPS